MAREVNVSCSWGDSKTVLQILRRLVCVAKYHHGIAEALSEGQRSSWPTIPGQAKLFLILSATSPLEIS